MSAYRVDGDEEARSLQALMEENAALKEDLECEKVNREQLIRAEKQLHDEVAAFRAFIDAVPDPAGAADGGLEAAPLVLSRKLDFVRGTLRESAELKRRAQALEEEVGRYRKIVPELVRCLEKSREYLSLGAS
jgi:hypothetical protein